MSVGNRDFRVYLCLQSNTGVKYILMSHAKG